MCRGVAVPPAFRKHGAAVGRPPWAPPSLLGTVTRQPPLLFHPLPTLVPDGGGGCGLDAGAHRSVFLTRSSLSGQPTENRLVVAESQDPHAGLPCPALRRPANASVLSGRHDEAGVTRPSACPTPRFSQAVLLRLDGTLPTGRQAHPACPPEGACE